MLKKITYLLLILLCLNGVFALNYDEEIRTGVKEKISSDVISELNSTENLDLIIIEDESILDKFQVKVRLKSKAKVMSKTSKHFNGSKSDLLKEVKKGKIKAIYKNQNYSAFLSDAQRISKYDLVVDNNLNDATGIKIAILDTGYSGDVTYFEDFSNSNSALDVFGHGKYVQSIIQTMAPNSEIYSLKVLGNTGSGSSISIYNGIMKAVDLDVDIIQMSLGVPIDDDPYVRSAIEYANSQGIVVVASSGNCGSGACSSFTGVTFPAKIPEVIAVGSISKLGERSLFSSTGNEVDVVAVAENINVMNTYISGTSFAAPQVSAAIALKMKEKGNFNSNVAQSYIETSSVDLGELGKDAQYGYGYLDFGKLFNLSSNNNTYEINNTSQFSISDKMVLDNPNMKQVIFLDEGSDINYQLFQTSQNSSSANNSEYLPEYVGSCFSITTNDKIELGIQYSSRIGSSGEYDWGYVDLPNSGLFNFKLVVPNGVDYDLKLSTDCYHIGDLCTKVSTGAGVDENCNFYTSVNRIYFMIKGKTNADWSATSFYDIHTSLTIPSDGNDDCADAVNLDPIDNTFYAGRISTSDDVDWYKWHLSNSGTFSNYLEMYTLNKDYGFKIYDSCGGTLLCSGTGSGKDKSCSHYVSSSGYVYTKIYGLNGDFSSNDDYFINGEFIPDTTVTCYQDADGDEYGNLSISKTFSSSCENGYVLNNNDCNDDSSNAIAKYQNPESDWFYDGDNDRYVQSFTPIVINQCARPTHGKLMNELSSISKTDCDDTVYSSSNTCSLSSVNYCSGQVQVTTKNNQGKALSQLKIYLDGAYEKNTDNAGVADFSFTNAVCNQNKEFKVKCSDDTTLCGLKTTQIDYNGDFDSLIFDCSVCTTDKDIYLSNADVTINGTKVQAKVHSQGMNTNLNVKFYRQNSQGIIVDSYTKTVTINSNSETIVTQNFNSLNENDYIHIYVNSTNYQDENNLDNNYVFRAVSKPIKAYLNVKVDKSYSNLNPVIEDYLSSYVELQETPTTADYIIIVGNVAVLDSKNISMFLDKNENSSLNDVKYPYTGVIKMNRELNTHYSFTDKNYIYIYGAGIEGTIAGVKRFINGRNQFLYINTQIAMEEKINYVDKYDTLGLQVNDLLHNSENEVHLKNHDDEMPKIVTKILYDNNFEVAIKPVRTPSNTSYGQSTDLRIKHLNSDFSQKYKDTIGVSNEPVVMSGGLFSNINTFEDFGNELVDKGQDVWLIEMTGGPNTDCSNCSNYNYEDLVDYYYPASIAGVLAYSGKNKTNYIGHSNGCRAALSSLNKYSQSGKESAGYIFNYETGQWEAVDLNSLPVDKFFGIACPSTLNGESAFTKTTRYTYPKTNLILGRQIMSYYNGSTNHMDMNDFTLRAIPMILVSKDLPSTAQSLITLSSLFPDNEISYNLFNYYIKTSIETNTTMNISNLTVNKLVLYNGYPDDLILNYEDGIYLNNSATNIINRFLITVSDGSSNHGFIKSNKYVKLNITGELK